MRRVPIRQSPWRTAWGGLTRWSDLCLPFRHRGLVLALVGTSLLVPSVAAGSGGPSITPSIRGTSGANGWYRSKVIVNWMIQPPPESSTGCDAVTLVADTHGRQLVCSATWDGGTIEILVKRTFKIDKTPPVVRGAADRKPDANGWYNHPLTVTFSGGDAMSGIAGCSSVRYGGPDNPSAAVSGHCIDRAGNVRIAVVSLKYDSTPPKLGKLRVKNSPRSVRLRWTASPDTQRVKVVRSSPGRQGARHSTVYSGGGNAYRDKGLRIGARYRYTVIGFDDASNSASRTVAVTATGRLLNPVPGARVTSPPRLVWTAVRGASYYNVQLIRGGKVLSAWPARHRLDLRRSWVYKGHRHRLHRGVYRWYVWPGFGRKVASHYGRRVGSSSFFFAG